MGSSRKQPILHIEFVYVIRMRQMVDYSICDFASHASVHKHGNISAWNCAVFKKLLNDPLTLTVDELALVLNSDVFNYSPLAKWLLKPPITILHCAHKQQ
jgi:hypothetical protein